MDSTGQSKLRTSLTIAAVALGAYLLGGFAYHERFFPFELVQQNTIVLTEQKLPPTSPKPRNSIFEVFSPQADIVMIGDSITNGGEWREMFPDRNIANRGIGGDTTEDILRRMGPILAVQAPTAFIMAGINDFFYVQSVDEVFANYVDIVNQLRARNITVFIQSTLECSKHMCGKMLESVRELNARLKDYADKNGIAFIDINKGMTSTEEGLLDQFTYDGVHLLGSGYLVWRDNLKPYMK